MPSVRLLEEHEFPPELHTAFYFTRLLPVATGVKTEA
jgi:hypothetical protein